MLTKIWVFMFGFLLFFIHGMKMGGTEWSLLILLQIKNKLNLEVHDSLHGLVFLGTLR